MIYTTDIMGYQWEIFVKAIPLGLLLGGCYDVLRIIRTVIRFGKKLYIASDFIYCLRAGFLTFSFLLNENFGMPRFYIFFGIGIGFLCWYFTVGKVSMFFAKILRKILRTVLRPVFGIFRKKLKIIEKRFAKAKINYEKDRIRLKSLLKNRCKVVYNILCLNISKAFSFCGEKAGKEPEEVESNGTEKTEKGTFNQDRSYCIRGVSSDFPDFDAGKHQ